MFEYTDSNRHASACPRIAVVMALHKHPGLAFEAIQSALRQETSFSYRVVLVNDGCPFDETHSLCNSYALAHPDRVVYLHKNNGGLSSARNAGVRLALESWATVRAIYFLDADNRIWPHVLERSFRCLETHPEVDWVFPDIAMFGSSRLYVDMSGDYSVFEQVLGNYCEAGSMVRRSVFDSGIYFDEQMRLGYEDWDFWLQAAGAGLRGRHRDDLGFAYRKRRESMLRNSGRDDAVIRAYLKRKHAELFKPRRLVELEQEELPRFAIYLADEGRIICTSDPRLEGRGIAVGDFALAMQRFSQVSQVYPLPPLFAITTRRVLDALRETGLAPGVFWHMQNSDDSRTLSFVRIEQKPGIEVRFQWSSINDESSEMIHSRASLVMMKTELLERWLSCANAVWADGKGPASILNGKGRLCFDEALLTITGPGEMAPLPDEATQELFSLVHTVGQQYRRVPRIPARPGWTCGRPVRRDRSAAPLVPEVGSILPAVWNRSRLQVGYTVPICEFGGVERVVHNMGRVSREAGWDPHLFVLGSSEARMLREFEKTFESVTVVRGEHLLRPDRLLGLLGTMDVVVNNHCFHFYKVAGDLRRMGVMTFAHLHVVDLSPDGLPCGHPYWALEYEHAMDGIVVVSRAMERWCSAWGIPRAKLVHVPNAPSFGISEAQTITALAERAERDPRKPLRVLYIGRFDRQKGLDRLTTLVAKAEDSELPVEWRIVGKAILHDADYSGHGPESLMEYLHPLAMTAAALSRHYRWADIMILVSRYEGAPLTILEAQAFGCVVLSPTVGAIGELIEDGMTGFLFSEKLDSATMMSRMLARLTDLHRDRNLLLTIGRQAAEYRRAHTWSQSFAPFVRFVETLRSTKRVR